MTMLIAAAARFLCILHGGQNRVTYHVGERMAKGFYTLLCVPKKGRGPRDGTLSSSAGLRGSSPSYPGSTVRHEINLSDSPRGVQ